MQTAITDMTFAKLSPFRNLRIVFSVSSRHPSWSRQVPRLSRTNLCQIACWVHIRIHTIRLRQRTRRDMHHNPDRPGPPPSADEGVVLYEKRDRIAYVTINRPEARNAVSPEVHQAMIAAWADFAEDDSVDVAILTGAGDAFCAGADLKEYIPPIVAEGSITDIREIAELGLNGFTRGQPRISKPIIGAINGWALAGRLETALACDIRIASDRAMFGSFEARRGFHHGDGGIVRLVNSGGVGVASHMLLTAEQIDAATALQWNMVTKVVPHDSLMNEA